MGAPNDAAMGRCAAERAAARTRRMTTQPSGCSPGARGPKAPSGPIGRRAGLALGPLRRTATGCACDVTSQAVHIHVREHRRERARRRARRLAPDRGGLGDLEAPKDPESAHGALDRPLQMLYHLLNIK